MSQARTQLVELSRLPSVQAGTRFANKRVRAVFDLVPLSDGAVHIAVTAGL
jgi:hypothetical protein